LPTDHEHEFIKILGGPGHRVYSHETDEKAKRLSAVGEYPMFFPFFRLHASQS